jgi:N-formylmaleamate deformylase
MGLSRIIVLGTFAMSLGLGRATGAAAAGESGKVTELVHIETGTVAAEKYGDGGTPLIFIAGLAGGAWSWNEMVERFAPTHEVYALTLAGFSGRPPAEPPVIDKVVADIGRLIREKSLNKPILVGHSLGAFIAFRVAIEHADLVGGVIALDGFPVFSPLVDATPAERLAAANRLANALGRGKSPEEFRAALGDFLRER